MTGLILAAAGSAARFGGPVPKQFLLLEGKPLYQAALLRLAPHVDEAVVVVSPSWLPRVEKELDQLGLACRTQAAAGGRERQDSVYQGLRRIGRGIDLVLVHDAARPYVSDRLVRDVIAAARLNRAAVPGMAISETVKEVADEKVVQTLDRARLRLIQTPQGFQRELLEKAFETAFEDGFYGTDEAVLVERLGIPVHVVPGDPRNIKITFPEDLSPGDRR